MTVVEEKISRKASPVASARPLIIVNDDTCSLRYVDPPHTDESLKIPLQAMAGSQVGAITWNLGQEVAYSWPSRVLENYFDKVKATANQPQHESDNNIHGADAWLPPNESRNVLFSMHLRGIDYLPRFIDVVRAAGLKFYGSFRMNDIHHRSDPHGPLGSTFWKEHQHYRLWDITDAHTYYNGALDYSFAEVRQRRLAAIRETLEWYDFDGIELDFCREPYTFPPAEAWQKRQILTDFIREVRALLESAGRRRGKRLDLLMRVPLQAEKLHKAGMDVNAWIEEALIDVLIMSSLLNDYNATIEPWVSRCRDAGIPFYPSLEWNPVHNSVHNHLTLETVDEVIRRQRAAAQSFLAQGAKGIYIFNYPCLLYQMKRTPEEFRALAQIYSELGKADTLSGKPRQYVFWNDLPMQLESCRPPQYHQTLHFNLHDPDLAGADVRMTLSFRQAVKVNPHGLMRYRSELPSMLPAGWVTYLLNGEKVPPEWITRQAQRAGKIPSGFELDAHEKITITPPATALKQGENRLAFHIDRFPAERDPYVHIYELLVDVDFDNATDAAAKEAML